MPAAATHTRTTRGLDQVIDVETPEQVVFSYTVAGIGSRAAAALLDHLIIFGSQLLLVILYLTVIPSAFGGRSPSDLLEQSRGWMFAVLILVQFVTLWGYYVLFEALWDGQTPGKRWLRLRVVQDGGYSVSFGASGARNISRIVDSQPLYTYLVGMITVAVSKSGKRAGDHLAGTIVVRERILQLADVPMRASAMATVAAPAFAAELTDGELDVLQRFLSRVDTLDAARIDAFVKQFAERFRGHLPEGEEPLTALRNLAEREGQARAQGAGARGEVGAAREQYALIAEGSERWNQFANTLTAAQKRGISRMSADEVASFVADYREVATDLARLATAARGRQMDVVFRLSRLVAGGHNLLYRQERVALRALSAFLFRTVPAELRRSAWPILAAALLFFGSGIVSYTAITRNPALVEQLVAPGMIDRAEVQAARARAGDRSYIDVEDYERPVLATRVISNNVQVSFFAFASGLTAGIFTAWLLLMNGIHIGAAFGLFQIKGVIGLIGDFVIAHSVLELTAICICAGGGFLIAGAILLPGAHTRADALVLQGRRALRLLTAAGLFLLVAGMIEGLISPRTDLSFAFKATVAALSALLIVVYVSLGRNKPA